MIFAAQAVEFGIGSLYGVHDGDTYNILMFINSNLSFLTYTPTVSPLVLVYVIDQSLPSLTATITTQQSTGELCTKHENIDGGKYLKILRSMLPNKISSRVVITYLHAPPLNCPRPKSSRFGRAAVWGAVLEADILMILYDRRVVICT